MHLHVGGFQFLARAQESEQRRRGQAEESAAGERVFRDFAEQAHAAGLGVVGDLGDGHAPLDAGVDVVAEVLADGGQFVPHLDAVLLQDVGAADAGQFEICGVLTAPAERMTSRPARASVAWPATSYSTPTQRLPSSSTRNMCASVSTRRFARCIAGRR